MISRALDRAKLPVSFTEGFNPRERISLPLPRSVGMSSADELLVVDLDQEVAPEALRERLSTQSPAGLRWGEVRALARGESPRARRATYEVRLDSTEARAALNLAAQEAVPQSTADGPPAAEFAEAVRQGVERLKSSARHLVTRTAHKPGRHPARTFDLRPLIEVLEWDGQVLRMVLAVSGGGSARATEVLEALGLPGRHLAACVRRIRVEWDPLDVR